MNSFQVKMLSRYILTIFVLNISFSFVSTENLLYDVHDSILDSSDIRPDIVFYEHSRSRRDVSTANVSPSSLPNVTALKSPESNTTQPLQLVPDVSNVTTNKTEKPVEPEQHTTSKVSDPILPNEASTAVEQHLLGVNGSGIRHDNVTSSVANVNDSILSNDELNKFYKETPERIKAEENITSLTFDNHDFYNSSFIGNLTYFQEYWTNITNTKAQPHDILSNSHRRATTFKLSFDFPFYGHNVRNITVATGGFLYTGELVHNWLAATQYISPLMANFDTTMTNDSVVKMYDDGEKFSVFWENATLQEAPKKKFTFAVTLYKNGDIVFAYKDIPIPVQDIEDKEHPVKVGISDAYLKDKIQYYVRRKTIYEYHRVSLKNHEITNNTVLVLTALPTCLQYKTCQSCVNHNTAFKCSWCEQIQLCSSGTDRNKQDWLVRNCNKFTISDEASCPAVSHVDAPSDVNTAYKTDVQANRDTLVNTLNTDEVKKPTVPLAAPVSNKPTYTSSSVGGVITAFTVVALICCAGAWLIYAFKNPLSRSGQLLIRYRPSQWGWRRGEARYTAATIHM